MNTKHRVFAHEFNENYVDYLKNKNGVEMLKNRKTKKQPIKTFINYREFIVLTNAYYKHIHCGDVCNIKSLSDLYNSNESFILYEKVLAHIGNCEYCSKNIRSFCYLECRQLLNILYPYGEYITKTVTNYHFLSHIDLDKWCVTKPTLCHLNNYIDTNIVNDFGNNRSMIGVEVQSCCGKYGLCKNAKPLFTDC